MAFASASLALARLLLALLVRSRDGTCAIKLDGPPVQWRVLFYPPRTTEPEMTTARTLKEALELAVARAEQAPPGDTTSG